MATAITEDFGDAVLIVGGGLAGLAAALELTRAGERAVILDQEPEASLGGQAFWSYGGVFYVDSPYQRSLGIRDSYELARRDWFNSAQFDRPDTEDKWAIQWAEAYLRWVTDRSGLQSYLQDLGIEIFPTVSWAERGGLSASGHGNSVPRFHITWGTGPALVKLFVKPLRAAEANGLVTFRFRHKVDELTLGPDGSVVGATGSVLQPSEVARGVKSSRANVGKFVYRARAIVISTGGIGGNPDLIRQLWPTQVLGPCPENFVLGVPNHVDGSGLALGREAGGAIVNPDRLWFYTEVRFQRGPHRSLNTENTNLYSRVYRTGIPSGQTTESGSFRVHHLSGSMQRVSACRRRCTRAAIQLPRSSIFWQRGMTIRGTSWTAT